MHTQQLGDTETGLIQELGLQYYDVLKRLK